MIARENRQVLTLKAIVRLSRIRRESDIQRVVLAVFRSAGILCWPMNRERAGRRRASHVGFKGLPDIGGVLPGGRAFFVEVKRPGQPLSPHQLAAAAMLGKQGAALAVVRGLDDARSVLVRLGLA